MGVAAQDQIGPCCSRGLEVPRLMVKPDRVAVIRAAGHQLRSRKTAAVGVQVVLAAHDAHPAGQYDGGILENAHPGGSKAALQLGAAKARLPPVVEQVMVAQHIVFAQRRAQRTEQGAEGFQFLRLGKFVKNIAGQHQQVGAAGLDLLAQLRDAGVIHRGTGARVDITDLHDGQPAVRQTFPRCQAVFCRTEVQRLAPAPPHNQRRQQPRRYAIQPENAPNGQRHAADTPQHQPNAGADAVKGHQMPDKDDAKAQRVPADIGQQRHQHQRQAVVQHRPLGHKLQRRQL